MSILLVAVFILGYLLIALELPLKIDKAASALLTGVICWLVLTFGIEMMPAIHEVNSGSDSHSFVTSALFEHLGEISEILFFLLGAMTIVELIDAHDGFRVITDKIKTTNRVKLLWPPIHNIIVVTSPMGDHAPPELAAIMTNPPNNHLLCLS